jgi:hypothetical protein
MDGWMDGWMNEWTNRLSWVSGRMDGFMDLGWSGEHMVRWVTSWVDG